MKLAAKHINAAAVMLLITANAGRTAPVVAAPTVYSTAASASGKIARTQIDLERPAQSYAALQAARHASKAKTSIESEVERTQKKRVNDENEKLIHDLPDQEQHLETRVNPEGSVVRTLDQLNGEGSGISRLVDQGKLPVDYQGAQQSYERAYWQWRNVLSKHPADSEEARRASEAHDAAYNHLAAFDEHKKADSVASLNHIYHQGTVSAVAPRNRSGPRLDPKKTGDKDDPDWRSEAQQAQMTAKEFQAYRKKMKKRRLARGAPVEHEPRRNVRTKFWKRPKPERAKTGDANDPEFLSEAQLAQLSAHDIEQYHKKMTWRRLIQKAIKQLDTAHVTPQSAIKHSSLTRQASIDESWIENVLQSPSSSSTPALSGQTASDEAWIQSVFQSPSYSSADPSP